MKIRPMFDCVFIEQEAEKHEGLIVVPSSEKKLFQGTIAAIGPGIRTEQGKWIEMTLKVGDRVLFGEFSGQAAKIGDKNLLAMREKDVIGILDAE